MPLLEKKENFTISGHCPSSSSSSSTSHPSYSYRDTYHRFLDCRTHSFFSQSIMEQLRAPFIEIPPNLMDSSLVQSYDIKMGLSFRFLPGQPDYLEEELKLPESFDRLTLLCNSLGLSSPRRPFSAESLYYFSWSGTGLRGCLVRPQVISSILVEVLTYFDGYYGRFLVLVCLGIGCTVWYTLVPGVPHQAPDISAYSAFAPLDSYQPFFNMEYISPGFRKVSFVESHDLSELVESTLANEQPFAEITIPASGPVLRAVGLGVMVAFFLAVGIIPNINQGFNIEL